MLLTMIIEHSNKLLMLMLLMFLKLLLSHHFEAAPSQLQLTNLQLLSSWFLLYVRLLYDAVTQPRPGHIVAVSWCQAGTLWRAAPGWHQATVVTAVDTVSGPACLSCSLPLVAEVTRSRSSMEPAGYKLTTLELDYDNKAMCTFISQLM